MSRSVKALPDPRAGATVLVTGASSGVGVAFAREFARRGHHVTLAARRTDRLQRLAGELPHALAARCDVADPDSRDELLALLDAQGLEVDVLINCAGFGGGGAVYDYNVGRAVEMLRTNVEAVFALCGALTPAMVARRSGAIVIASSLAGILTPPVRFAAYGASKAASLRYAVGLHYELRQRDVAVTVLCPGPMDTEFGQASGLQKTMAAMPEFVKATPEQCVANALDALARGRAITIPNPWVRAAAALARRTPAPIAAKVLPLAFRV